ncbi:MAG: hypothetical protein Q9199_006330 [Rusavskia elegans]
MELSTVSETFTPKEMEHLTTSFTLEELQKIKNKHSRKELEDAIERHGRSRIPLTKTFMEHDLTDCDAPGDAEELDAAQWHSKNDQSVDQRSTADERSSRHRPSTKPSKSLAISQDVPEQATKLNKQRSSRPSPLSKNSTTRQESTRPTKAIRNQTKPSRVLRGHLSDAENSGRPSSARPAPKPASNQGSRFERAPTELERGEAGAEAHRLSEELRLGWHNRAEKVKMGRDIQRLIAVANGGWIQLAAERQPSVKEERKRDKGSVKASNKRVREADIDIYGYRPGEKEELQERYARETTQEEEIDLEGNIIPRKRARNFAVQSPFGAGDVDEYVGGQSGKEVEETEADCHRVFDDDDEEVLPRPKKRGSIRKGDAGGYHRR